MGWQKTQAPLEGDQINQAAGARRFEDRWSVIRTLDSGHQAFAYEAESADGKRAFIKVLRSTSTERRHRFCQEVGALIHLDVPGIPKLLESNAEHFADPSYELYLAAEFVEGNRLNDFVDGGLSAKMALDLALAGLQSCRRSA